MYYRRIVPVNQLINYLQEVIGELQAIGEDEIVAADFEVLTVDSVINDIVYDKEYQEEYVNLAECLETIPPHIILNYIHFPKDEAKTDGYWETFHEYKNEIWAENIYPRIKDQLVSKRDEKEQQEEQEAVEISYLD